MSGIPSDIAGSALQAGLQQNTVSGAQDNERNRAVDIARRAALRAMQKEDDVVGDETDMTVHTEGGGTGGQGRSFSEPSNEEPTGADEVVENQHGGITTDENGQTHIDFEA